jgi:hypothetical protein
MKRNLPSSSAAELNINEVVDVNSNNVASHMSEHPVTAENLHESSLHEAPSQTVNTETNVAAAETSEITRAAETATATGEAEVGAEAVNEAANAARAAETAAGEAAAETRYTVAGMAGTVGEISQGWRAAADVVDTIGKVGSGIGIGLSGASLGMDIAEAVKDKHVTFDNAMRMADDGTGLVSAAVSFVPAVGVPISLAMLGGEKLVTSIIKIIIADREAKKNNGGKGVGFNRWVEIAEKAALPNWMVGNLNKKKEENEAEEEANERIAEIKKGEAQKQMNYRKFVHQKAVARNENERRGGY